VTAGRGRSTPAYTVRVQAPGPDVRRNVRRVRLTTVNAGVPSTRADTLAGEEPMEIRAGGPGQEPAAVAVTMRTPGGDFELAAGFLFTEGLVRARAEIASVAYCELPAEDQHYNVVTVRLTRPWNAEAVRRNFFATSSCGVCGKAALEDVETQCAPVGPGPVVAADVLSSLPDRLRRSQSVFDRTGGLHAAGLFDPAGSLIASREDVGRHNAVDKVIGERFLADDVPLGGCVLQVSGRLSFEIVQKAAVAGIPVVSAVSAPSSLAVDAADRLGMTVAGFVRDGRFNVYTHPERIG
jgi:FdhD protein